MGPIFVFLLWMAVASVVACLAGVVLAFVVIPLYRRHRRPDAWLQRRAFICRYGLTQKIIVTIGTAVGVTAASGVLLIGGYLWELRYESDYWMSAGMFDYWRWPLEYPYQMEAIDVLDRATLSCWEDHDTVDIDDITAYYAAGDWLVGQVSHAEDSLQYFVFDLRTGKAVFFEDDSTYEETMSNVGAVLGMGDSMALVPVEEQYSRWVQKRSEYAAAHRRGGR